MGKLFIDPIGSMVEMLAKMVVNAAFTVLFAVAGIGSKNETVSTQIAGETRWIIVYLSVGSILFAATKMALDRRAESGQAVLKGVLRLLLVSTAASTVIGLFVTLMDRYSLHLLRGALMALGEHMSCSGVGSNMLLLLVGVLLLIAAIIHAVMMWVRLGVMILLMGTLPLAAAASMTDWGTTWWRKHIGWMVAWLLYKPTVGLVLWSGAAMVSLTADEQAAGDAGKIDTQLAGMATLLLSTIALPALLRIIVPATEALGRSDAVGGATMGGVGGVASGAKTLGTGAVKAGLAGLQGPSGSSGRQGPGGASGNKGDAGGPAKHAPLSGGTASSGSRIAAASKHPAVGAVLTAAQVASKTAKGTIKDVARVAQGAVDDANRNEDNGGGRR